MPHRCIAAANMGSTGVTVHPPQEWLHAEDAAGGASMTVAAEGVATGKSETGQWAKPAA